MKKAFILLSILSVSYVLAQKTDSIKSSNIDEIVIHGKYYKKYTEKEGSSSLRLDEELLKIPQNISIITKQAIDDQQVTTLSDGVIRNVAGAQRLEHWGDLYTRINMRGSRAAAFFNGVNITSNWGPLSEDMSYVDHIEFVKGPSGFLMSNGEPSGIYNVVTKKPTGLNFNGSAKITLGSFDMYRGETDFDSKISDKVSVRLNLMAQNKNSFRKYEFNDRYVINPSVKINLTEKTTLIAEYIYQKAKMSQVGSAYVFSNDGFATKPVDYTLSDPGIAPTNVEDHTINFNLQHQFNSDWKLTAQLTYLNDYMLGSDIWPGSSISEDGSIIRTLYFWESSNVMKFGQVFLNGKIQTNNISHKILAGLDAGSKKYLADWNQSHNLDTEESPFNINSSSYSSPSNGYGSFDTSTSLSQRATPYGTILQNYSGLYLQDELGFLNDKLRLTLAARYTNVTENNYGTDSDADKITPRLGVSYSINTNTSLYTLYDQSFVPQAGFLRGGGSVKPITGNNFEIGVKKDWLGGKWNTTLSIYSILKRNELTNDPSNVGTESYSVILGKSRVQGIEFDLKGEILKGLNTILNYAFTENKIIKSNTLYYAEGDKIAGYAKHTINGWLNYTFPEGILEGVGLTFGGSYLGDRSTWTWGSDGAQNMNDYIKFDAGMSWENTKIKLNLNVFNVFNRYLYSGSYYAWGGYYYYQAEAPRNWRLSIAYKF